MPSAAHADDRARRVILELVEERGTDKTICPSEAARALAGDRDFRPFMELVREAAGALAADGRVEVTQKGAAGDDLRGPRSGADRPAGALVSPTPATSWEWELGTAPNSPYLACVCVISVVLAAGALLGPFLHRIRPGGPTGLYGW